ncbi:MAG TPA: DUF1553 domain-containing protein [Pirellulales bacterium]|jgi:hypothetical protein|nr:DUF1553 domain-containing protein [Pirellulales bacterium]
MARPTTTRCRASSLLLGAIVALWVPLRGVAADSETELIERRTRRVAELPAIAGPPAIDGVDHPIDRFIAAKLTGTTRALPPSGEGGRRPDEGRRLCDDATFLRRAYLDTVGVIPTVSELNRFLADSSADKRRNVVDQLLDRHGDYAAHWTPFWEDALASQNVNTQGGIPTHGNYRRWITESFEHNRPFDVMVAELIDPTMPGRRHAESTDILGTKYAIEYVRNDDHTATLQTAANVAQVFLGTSMKCASCHDHFENREWPQDRFLAFAGLFAPHDLELIRCEVHSGKTVKAAFPFELHSVSEAVPTGLDDRLHALAQWIVDPANPRFARSIVNRLWKRYLGLRFIEPADDFRLDVPPSHPELLDWLARDFVSHGCDLKHTIRLILTSATYQARYDPALDDHFNLAEPTSPRYFRSPALRRLTCEQFLDSVRLATTERLAPEERAYLDSRSTSLSRALGRPASRNEVITGRPDDVAVVQSLELLNGPELRELIDRAVIFERPLRKIDLPRVVDRLYRSVLSRPPNADERRLALAYLGTGDAYAESVKDLYWALVCSPEFVWIK